MIDALFAAPSAWVDRVDDDLRPSLKAAGWVAPPGGVMPGTREFQNKKLWHVLLNDGASIGDIASLIPGQCLGAVGEEIPATYDAEGNELTPRTRPEVIPLNTTALVNYMNDIVVYDEDGNEVSRTRPVAWAAPHIYGGREW